MKLRIKGNSLRLRLTQNEIKTFEENGVVEEVIKFGNDVSTHMHYLIQKSEGKEINAFFQLNQIVVNLPIDLVEKWTSTDQVGFEYHLPLNEHENLFILVEKDSQCLQSRPNENEEDMFPNPSEGVLEC